MGHETCATGLCCGVLATQSNERQIGEHLLRMVATACCPVCVRSRTHGVHDVCFHASSNRWLYSVVRQRARNAHLTHQISSRGPKRNRRANDALDSEGVDARPARWLSNCTRRGTIPCKPDGCSWCFRVWTVSVGSHGHEDCVIYCLGKHGHKRIPPALETSLSKQLLTFHVDEREKTSMIQWTPSF